MPSLLFISPQTALSGFAVEKFALGHIHQARSQCENGVSAITFLPIVRPFTIGVKPGYLSRPSQRTFFGWENISLGNFFSSNLAAGFPVTAASWPQMYKQNGALGDRV